MSNSRSAAKGVTRFRISNSDLPRIALIAEVPSFQCDEELVSEDRWVPGCVKSRLQLALTAQTTHPDAPVIHFDWVVANALFCRAAREAFDKRARRPLYGQVDRI